MNIERLEQMRDWLNDGAPHVIFDMSFGNESFQDAINEMDLEGYDLKDIAEVEADPGSELERAKSLLIQRNEKGIGSCGSVCCIAGYAVQAFGTKEEKNLVAWYSVASLAMGMLGLESNNSWYFHDLFSNELAPDNCTPQQAAQAVQNVIDGKTAWSGIA